MKQLERSTLITYRWWRDGDSDIKPEHVSALEEAAESRISDMMAQGYIRGQLVDNICMSDDDPEDGVEYTGWWEATTPGVP